MLGFARLVADAGVAVQELEHGGDPYGIDEVGLGELRVLRCVVSQQPTPEYRIGVLISLALIVELGIPHTDDVDRDVRAVRLLPWFFATFVSSLLSVLAILTPRSFGNSLESSRSRWR